MSRTILRTFTLAIALTTASIATADTYFGNGTTLEASDMLALGLVTSDRAGTVEVYDFHTGTIGPLLGTQDIHVGANTDVRVRTGLPVNQNVLVVVRVDDQIMAEKVFDVQSD